MTRNKRNRETRGTPSPSNPISKKANTEVSIMPPKPSLSISADKTISTEKMTPEMTTPTNPRAASTASPFPSPVANLSNEENQGQAGAMTRINAPSLSGTSSVT